MNSNQLFYYAFIFSFSKCGGSCDAIDDLYVQTCVPNIVKSLNLKVFNLMLRGNKTQFKAMESWWV